MKIFKLGFIHIPFFGIMIAIGFFTALYLFQKEGLKKGYNKEKMGDLAMFALLGGIIGGRLSYIFFYNFSFYANNPMEIIKIYKGGMSIHGGIIGGLIAVLIYIRKNKEFNLYDVADLVSAPLILAQGIGRVGCDVYGKIMYNFQNIGIKIGEYYYHPTQVYEFTLNYLLFTYLYVKKDRTRYRGQLFAEYLIGFGLIRSIVELFRDNPKYFGLSISHYLSLVLIIIGFGILRFLKKKNDIINVNINKNKYSFVFYVLFLYLISIFLYYYVQLNF